MARIYLICALLLTTTPRHAQAEAYSESMNIADRLTNGPQMLSQGLEFVAAASFTTLHVAYNIYLHTNLARNAALPPLDPKRILAEERMVSEASGMCNNHLRANECYVFLWEELADIPPGDKYFIPYGLALSNGIYRNLKGSPATFNWRNDPRKDVSAKPRADALEPYQRDVKAHNRFLSGPRMMAEDLEFISAESMIRLTVIYHLYVHPKLLRNINLRDLSRNHIAAEKELQDEAQKACSKHKKAAKCVVLFWGELATIPLEKKQETFKKFFDDADGYYLKELEKDPEFIWR